MKPMIFYKFLFPYIIKKVLRIIFSRLYHNKPLVIQQFIIKE